MSDIIERLEDDERRDGAIDDAIIEIQELRGALAEREELIAALQDKISDLRELLHHAQYAKSYAENMQQQAENELKKLK